MQNEPVKIPTWYWIVSVLALIWMFFGVFAWLMDLMMDEAALANLTEPQRNVYLSRPDWIFLVYAVAVFSGFLGAVGLLMRKTWATTALLVSVIAVVIQFAYTLLVMDTINQLGAGAALPFPIFILVMGLFLLWLARFARRRAWLM